MNCGHQQNLTRWLDGSLPAAEARQMAAHLDSCPACADLVVLWRELGELPELAPPPAVRARFARLLDTTPRPRRLQWVAVAAMVAAAFGAGYAVAPRPDPQTAALHGEVRQLRSLVALSLLEQQSAGQRLRGIGFAGQEPAASEVLDALIAALQHDPSVDVRLAAARALRRGRANPRVRQGFAEALAHEESPLVQVVLIETLVEFGEKRSMEALRKLAASSEDGAVRERARWAAHQLEVTNH